MNNIETTGVNHSIEFHRTSTFAYLILTLTTFFFAVNHVIGRGVRTEVPPVGLSFWRWLFGAILLLPFVWRGLYTSTAIIRTHLPTLFLLGCLMIGSTTIMLVALNFTTAINVALINATQPVMTILLAWLFLKEKLTRIQIVGVLAGLGGVVVMVSRADWRVIIDLQMNIGDGIVLLGMLGFSTYAINLYKIPKELKAGESLFVIILTGCLALAPFYLAETALYHAVPINATAIAAILTLALTVSLFAMLMWNVGNQILGPGRAGMFINLVPVNTAILAITFLGEHLYLYHCLGAILISCGIYFVLRNHNV
ncbi:MAG: DMT family transporter [Gammaproteobacteria bacterium]